jgi:hypothetical protein
VNTNHESVAYRSFSPSKFEARGARKVTTGISDLVPKRSLLILDVLVLISSADVGQHNWLLEFLVEAAVLSVMGNTPTFRKIRVVIIRSGERISRRMGYGL